MQQQQQAPPVPPRQRRPPPPLGSQSVDPYMNNNTYGNPNMQYNNGSAPYYNKPNNVAYQNTGNHNNNGYLQFPNNTRHQRMNSSSSGIMSPPQAVNSYPPQTSNTYNYSPQQQINNYSPSHSTSYPITNYPPNNSYIQPSPSIQSVQSSPGSIRGPPPRINYASQSPLNNPSPIQQVYGPPQNPRIQVASSYEQRPSPEIYISSENSLPNPPRKYPPSPKIPVTNLNNNVPPTPRRQVIPPSGNTHKIMPVQISPVRSNASSSPSLSPQLQGSNSPKPPRRSMLLESSNSPPYRYAHPSYSPSLGESAPPVPVRQFQRGRAGTNSSISSQKLFVNPSNGMGNSSPGLVPYNINGYHSPSFPEETGSVKSASNHKRNYSYSSSITVPNMDLNDSLGEDGYYYHDQNNLMVNNNASVRHSMISQSSGISQLSGLSKGTGNNYGDAKESEYAESTDDEYIEEAKGSKNQKRISIEAEEIEKDLADSSLIFDEKTLADNAEKLYKNLDPKEASELQQLSNDLKNFEDNETIKFDDFDLDAINDAENKLAKKNEVHALPSLDLDISGIKSNDPDDDIDDINDLSEKLDQSNKALLNVLTDEIKDLFNKVDENDAKDHEISPISPIGQPKKNRYDSVESIDSLHVDDVFTHMRAESPYSPAYSDESFRTDSVYSYQYNEQPSVSYRNSMYSNQDGYYGDDKSFTTYVSTNSAENRSFRAESISNPSLDPSISSVPPKRPPRYYEMDNANTTTNTTTNNTNNNKSVAPAVPPRRHFRNEANNININSNPNGVRQNNEMAPPTPPRTNMSLSSNKRIVNNTMSNINYGNPNIPSSYPASYGSELVNMNDELKKSNTSKTVSTINTVELNKSNTSKTVSTVNTVDESSKEEKFEDDYVYHSGDVREKFPLVNHSANMSEIADNFRKRIKLVKHIKDSIEYMQSFSGYDAVTALAEILGTDDRKVAQTTGQALEEQGMFHDVVYLHKLLDSHYHYYQFEDLAKPIAILERKETERLNPNIRASTLIRKLSERKNSTRGEFEESDPCGVLVGIAQCYSPTCSDESPCYAYSCPRRRIMETVTAKETAGRFANMSMTIGLQTTWSTSLGKSYVSKMSHQQIKRQEIIYEFIRTEKEYVTDLQSVIKYMIIPLRHGKVMGIDSRFVDSVFGNIEEISQVNSDFYENLRKIQKRKPVLESLGDVVKESVGAFICYTKYGENQPSAKQILQVQKNKNMQLNAFLKECQNMPQFRRLPIESFLARPTTRLGRYPILIRDILKNTSKNHRDQILLKEANTTIENILKKVNQLAGKETNRLKMEQWSELLRFEKKNDITAVHFEDPKREYIREGKLSLVVHNYVNEPVIEVTLLLLDNVLIITYEKNNNCHIYGKPIPISLLTLSYTDQKRSLKPHGENSSSIRLVVNNHNKNNKFESMGYVFTVKHLGVGSYTFYTPIQSEQKAWVEAIQKQQESLPKPIAREVIFFSHKKLDSPVQTVHRLKNGALLLANDIGLYVLVKNTMMKPLLQLSRITQIESMEQFDILFVLSNRETYAFSINLLLKGVYTNPNYVKHNKKISSNVSFIATGFCDDKFILCCVKASTNKTVVKMFEPKKLLANPNYRKTYQKLYLTGDVMINYKQFYIPSEGIKIRFLRRSLCVACNKSFEVVSIRNLTTQSLLNPNDVVFKNLLKSEYTPMNMFKTQQNDFLLCYNKIGFFIDKNGNRSRPNIFFKWNAIPKSFAYHSPYIYVITTEYISIWNEYDPVIQKQIIPGNSIRLLLHDDNQNLIYSKLEDGKQRIATIELLKLPVPPMYPSQMQFPPPQIKN